MSCAYLHTFAQRFKVQVQILGFQIGDVFRGDFVDPHLEELLQVGIEAQSTNLTFQPDRE